MPFLPEALQSIRNQTYRKLEILCIDDGSTDETYKYLKEQADIDPRIVLVKNERNMKLIATLNKGVQLAKGKYIARMDADDIALPNRIEVSVGYLEQHPDIDLVCPQSIIIDEENQQIGKTILRNYSQMGNYFASFLYTPVSHPTILCKTKMLRDIKYSTEKKAFHTEDYELWTRLLSLGYKFANISEYLQQFRKNSSSVSNTYKAIQDENFVCCASDHFYNYTGRRLSVSTRRIFNNRILKSHSSSEVYEALKELRAFKNFFIQKEAISLQIVIREIIAIYRTHRIDILIQGFKISKHVNKLSILFPLLCELFLCQFNPIARKYILGKVFR